MTHSLRSFEYHLRANETLPVQQRINIADSGNNRQRINITGATTNKHCRQQINIATRGSDQERINIADSGSNQQRINIAGATTNKHCRPREKTTTNNHCRRRKTTNNE